jgi:hypothetical protein
VSYGELAAGSQVAAGPFNGVVCNFALLHEDLDPLLRALRDRLGLDGRLFIQTLHPWTQDGPYADGWREERFDGLGESHWTPMPWYFRTLASWVAVLHEAGFTVATLSEPAHADGQPLSLLIEATLR